MNCCAARWQDEATEPGTRRVRNRVPWTAWEIAAMVLGFVVFWPVGLGILFWILWKKRHGDAAPAWIGRLASGLGSGSGNSAFEEWKRSELERLEQERRRLAEAEQEFAAFLDQLKRAKDREEFDRFKAARGRPAADDVPA